MPWGMSQGMCILQWEKCTCGLVNAHSNTNLLGEPVLGVLTGSGIPDAWSRGWDSLSLIRTWTRLKTNTFVFKDGFT